MLRKAYTMSQRQEANLQEGRLPPSSRTLLHHVHKLRFLPCFSRAWVLWVLFFQQRPPAVD